MGNVDKQLERRERIATAAMQALISNPTVDDLNAEEIAHDSVLHAKALMEELDVGTFNDAMKSQEIPWRAIFDWYMCSDPWPGGDQDTIEEWLNAAARAGGYSDWVDAYHRMSPHQA